MDILSWGRSRSTYYWQCVIVWYRQQLHGSANAIYGRDKVYSIRFLMIYDMNRVFTYLLILFSLAYMSCDKFLAVDIPDNLVHDEYWQNREQVLSSRNGMYSALHNNL